MTGASNQSKAGETRDSPAGPYRRQRYKKAPPEPIYIYIRYVLLLQPSPSYFDEQSGRVSASLQEVRESPRGDRTRGGGLAAPERLVGCTRAEEGACRPFWSAEAVLELLAGASVDICGTHLRVGSILP